jgi:hypothetical protein
MHRDMSQATARRRRVAVAAVGLLAVLASLGLALPASAAGQACVDKPFGFACVTGTQHLDGTAFDGQLVDKRQDGDASVLTIWGYERQFREWRDLFVFVARRPGEPERSIGEFVPRQIDWLALHLCRSNPDTGERECFLSENVYIGN